MNNTQSRLLELPEPLFSQIRNQVIFFDYNRFMRSSKWVQRNKRSSFYTYMIDADGFFPTGILHRVTDWMDKKGQAYKILDNRVKPSGKRVGLKTRVSEPKHYPDQEKAINALFEAQTGIAQLPTGVGKTRIIKDLIQRIDRRSVVICPSTNLVEQMAEYLEHCFGPEYVGIYQKKRDLKPVTVITFHSFARTDPRLWADTEFVAFDEMHHCIASTIRKLNQTHLNGIYHRYGVTATNFTNEDHELILLESVLSDTVFSMSIKEAIKKNYILPIQAVFFRIKNDQLTSSKDYQKDYMDFVVENKRRNEVISETISNCVGKGVPTLTLVNKIRHGKVLHELAGGKFLNATTGTTAENMQIVEEFNDLKHDHMIATSVVGEGVNTKACGAVINAKAGKSKKEMLQNIGRAVRKFPGQNIGFYFDFIDKGQKSLRAQSTERLKICAEEFGIEPIIIDV